MSAFDPLPHHRIRLLEADRDFADAVPADELPAARRLLVGDAHDLVAGRWTPVLGRQDAVPAFALLIVRGLVLREVVLGERRAAQLFGPGDLLRPAAAGDSSLSETVEWTVMAGGQVAVLDDVFLAAARRWPALAMTVSDRLFTHLDRSAVHLAIAQLPRIEQRLLGMFWYLADRFGRVTGAGVVVPFALTHEMLGRLVGARRPTVSLGLSALEAAGSVMRRPDGHWVLAGDSRTALTEITTSAARRRERLRLVPGGRG